MQKYLICYKFTNLSSTDRIRFIRELFGRTEQSHKGKYRYENKGKLQNYEKPVRSVIIIQEPELKTTLKTLKKYKAKTHTYKITEKTQ